MSFLNQFICQAAAESSVWGLFSDMEDNGHDWLEGLHDSCVYAIITALH